MNPTTPFPGFVLHLPERDSIIPGTPYAERWLTREAIGSTHREQAFAFPSKALAKVALAGAGGDWTRFGIVERATIGTPNPTPRSIYEARCRDVAAEVRSRGHAPDGADFVHLLEEVAAEGLGALNPEAQAWLKLAAEKSGMTRERVVELLVGGATLRAIMSGEHGGEG